MTAPVAVLTLIASLLAAPATLRSQPAVASVVADATQVAVGGEHTCALTEGGLVYCWGDNSFGQLGDGTTIDRPAPTLVAGLAGVVQISASWAHTCAVTAAGTAHCWGYNGYGRLGDGTTVDRLTPTLVVGVAGVIQISSSVAHTCALTSAGTAHCWGNNAGGQLGDGTTTDRHTPVPVLGLAGVTQVSAGWFHTCAITAAGTVHCWGGNGYGRLGDGTTSNRSTPTLVGGVVGATRVTASGYHSCASTAPGPVYCWGYNGAGQLGDGTTVNRHTAVTVDNLTGVIALDGGHLHTCAITVTLDAWCWGSNGNGRLGDGTTVERHTPTAVSGLGDAIGVDAHQWHTCATGADLEIACWGANSNGQLGDGTTIDRSTPTTVVLNAPPADPTLVSPENGYVFEGTESQVFTIRASDPNGDAYTGEVEVYNALTDDLEAEFVTSLAPSETDSKGTPVPPLEPGSYYWQARATDPAGSGAFGPWSNDQAFEVTPTVFGCEAATAVVDGYVGDALLRVGIDQPSATKTSVCMRFDDGGVSASGGRLIVEVPDGATTPTISSSTSVCDDPGGEPLPQPLLEGEIGGSFNPPTWIQFYADVRLAGNETTVCVKAGNAGSDDNLVSRAITIAVPDETVVPDVDFARYMGGDPLPLPAAHPAPDEPSALCQTSVTGTSAQVLNLAVDGVHTWLYTLTDGSQAHACARIEGPQSGGGRLSMDSAGGISPIADVQPGLSPDDPDSPCDAQIVNVGSPVVAQVYTVFPPDNPVSLCTRFVSSSLTATVGADGSPVLPTFEQDS